MMCLMYSVFIFGILQESLSGCIDGEVWFERCKYCRCADNREVCSKMECMTYTCIPGILWFGDDHRCHCNKHNQLTCVNLEFQKDLQDKPCTPNSYFYDTQTFCKCISGKTACYQLKGDTQTVLGYCEEGEYIIDNCYKCTCTKSLFRSCVLEEKCVHAQVSKPGRCFAVEHFYTRQERIFCSSVRKQECHTDYGCPGNKKCCHVTDCFYRCVDQTLLDILEDFYTRASKH